MLSEALLLNKLKNASELIKIYRGSLRHAILYMMTVCSGFNSIYTDNLAHIKHA